MVWMKTRKRDLRVNCDDKYIFFRASPSLMSHFAGFDATFVFYRKGIPACVKQH